MLLVIGALELESGIALGRIEIGGGIGRRRSQPACLPDADLESQEASVAGQRQRAGTRDAGCGG